MDSLNVLLVEDNSTDAQVIRRTFDQISQWETSIEEVQTHEEALEALEGEAHDLVLLDYRLPGKNGLNTLSILRDRDCHRPVIMMTGAGDETVVAKSFRMGAQDYLAKQNRNFLF